MDSQLGLTPPTRAMWTVTTLEKDYDQMKKRFSEEEAVEEYQDSINKNPGQIIILSKVLSVHMP